MMSVFVNFHEFVKNRERTGRETPRADAQAERNLKRVGQYDSFLRERAVTFQLFDRGQLIVVDGGFLVRGFDQ
jgi:hypothetical protein